MHIAAQYLAAAGISFLDKQPDDSHTNVGFSPELRIMYSRSLGDGDLKLQLSYDRFALEWTQEGVVRNALTLEGKSHQQVLTWLAEISREIGLQKPYVYRFHYELPYAVEADFTFRRNPSEIDRLAEMRITAHQAVSDLIDHQDIASEVRIWPHHFDTGAYGSLSGTSGISIGLGLAIPDSVSASHYYYVSGYDDHGIISPEGWDDLPLGSWHAGTYKGAVLPVQSWNREQIDNFLNAAVDAFKSL